MKKQIETEVKKRVKAEARKKVQPDKAALTAEGAEICDPQPLFADIGFKKAPDLNERIRQITAQVQADTLAKLQAQQMSDEDVQAILDEENDFEMPEAIVDTLTQYEAAGLVSDLEEQVYLEVEQAPVKETSSSTAEQSVEPPIDATVDSTESTGGV
jgi:hypothetical protein